MEINVLKQAVWFNENFKIAFLSNFKMLSPRGADHYLTVMSIIPFKFSQSIFSKSIASS